MHGSTIQHIPGDIRNILKTVSGLQNPEHSKQEVKKLCFLVNDIDPDILARDILLLEIIHSLDVEKVYIVTCHYHPRYLCPTSTNISTKSLSTFSLLPCCHYSPTCVQRL